MHFLYSSLGRLSPFDRQSLQANLPLERPTSNPRAQLEITYGAYLEGIMQFILNHWDQFMEILRERGPKPPERIQHFDIISEKHGSDYHPARLRAHCDGHTVSFVVNAALTERGRLRLEKDFYLLRSLHASFQPSFVPEVYFFGSENVRAKDGQDVFITMFIGEWLDGYHEFHLSAGTEKDSQVMTLWDLGEGYQVLSTPETLEIYRQAAQILTFYYDTKTFREVSPWHHASGDFVAGRFDGTIDVKLITVRQYEARTVFLESSPDSRFKALLIFFANLTVRMRLDRLDGVGSVAWAGEHCVGATIQGFFNGLKRKVAEGTCDQQFLEDFLVLLKRMSPGDLAEIFKLVTQAYDPDAPDVPVILEHLVNHILEVFRAVQDLPVARSQPAPLF